MFQDLILNKNKLRIGFDLDAEEWIILFPKYGQYVAFLMSNGSFERIHHEFVVGRCKYELVLDPNEEQTAWESWSIWDCRKNEYISDASGKFN